MDQPWLGPVGLVRVERHVQQPLRGFGDAAVLEQHRMRAGCVTRQPLEGGAQVGGHRDRDADPLREAAQIRPGHDALLVLAPADGLDTKTVQRHLTEIPKLDSGRACAAAAGVEEHVQA